MSGIVNGTDFDLSRALGASAGGASAGAPSHLAQALGASDRREQRERRAASAWVEKIGTGACGVTLEAPDAPWYSPEHSLLL